MLREHTRGVVLIVDLNRAMDNLRLAQVRFEDGASRLAKAIQYASGGVT